MFKFGQKVVIRDGSLLEGVAGIVCRIDESKVSVLLDKEVIWSVDSECLEQANDTEVV